MCGISGIISFNHSISPSKILKMTDIISYRGPDDFGYLAYNTDNKSYFPFKDITSIADEYNLYFGHRRLSILDLSPAGHQPFSYMDDRYWITYNGEIYNYIEIREELLRLGYKFRSNTDTEVILAAFHEWSNDCLNRFNGMWSFAILDKDTNTLFCSRDRLGVKPFYYNFSNGIFSFSSEIKQLLTLEHVVKERNNKSVADYLYYGTYNSIGEQTFFNEIFELKGGHYFTLNLNELNNKITPIKYWDIDLSKKTSNLADKEYAEKYLELFIDSVKLRMRCDVPLGSALSGGLDSSGIVSVVSKLLREQNISGLQKTFTSVSDQKQFDERNFAEAVIKNSNVEPYFVLPTANTLNEDFDKLIYHQEEPFISTSIYAGWCVSKLIKSNGVTVSLDGQGPDEMMGGYHPFNDVLAQNLLEYNLKEFYINLAGYHKIHGFSYTFIIRSVLSYIRKLNAKQVILKPTIFSKVGYNDIIKPNLNGRCILEKINNELPFDSYSYNATRVNTLPGILKQVDRNSMAFSVETRLPFLDYRLVEYTFSLPIHQKVRGAVSKIVYRNAMKGILPEEVRTRKSKLGFATAEAFWFKKEFKKTILDSFQQIPSDSIINKNLMINNYIDFCNDKAPFDINFWRVFNFINWEKQFING